MPPTIVLVHGAFAESSSWDRVIRELQDAGHDVIAAANPLRGLAADAAVVTDLVRTVDGPVVLVGHSYGGMVISNVAAAPARSTGSSTSPRSRPSPARVPYALAQRFPGSTLGDALQPVPRSNGTTDLYIDARSSTSSSPPTCRRPRPPAWPPRSGRSRSKRSRSPRRPSPVEGAPVLVPDRRAGPQHPRRAPALHGPPRRRPPHRRAPHRLARGRGLAPRHDRAPDPRSRLAGACRRLTARPTDPSTKGKP